MPSPGKNDRLLPIGRVAELAEVSERTLHYYEQVGLLTPAERDPGCRRQYTRADLDRLRYIRELQDVMGYSLAEIQSILDAEDQHGALRAAWRDQEGDPVAQRQLIDRALAMAGDHRQRVRAKAERLEGILARLDENIARYRQLRAQLDRATVDASQTGPGSEGHAG